MKMMKLVGAVCLGSWMVFALGCGKSKLLQATEQYEKDACACKDSACAAKAATAFGTAAKEAGAGSSGDAEAIGKATTHATECTMKLATSGLPGMPK